MKSRGFPINIEIKQATLRRFSLPENKRQFIEAEIAKDYAGYKGEKRLDYHLKVFKEPEVRIYNDLRFDDGNPFQIDTLIITPFFILPIDSKNFDGETKIDSIQSIQYDSKGNQKRLTNPISQAKRHNFLMMEWFQAHNYYSIPFESIIVNTNPLGILSADKNSPDIFKKIMNVEMVP